MNKPSFVLGTAQFGMPYGVANTVGKPNLEEILSIVQCAVQNDILFFDTAQDYGDCEDILAQCFHQLKITEKVNIISKINSPCIASIKALIKKMGLKSLYGLLWRGANPDIHFFEKLKAEGLVHSFGVSVYREEEVERGLENEAVEIIQLPFNIFDQRAITKRWFEKAEKRGKTIIVRSVYLQGLLLMKPAQLPSHLYFAKPYLEKYAGFCLEKGVGLREVAMNFVLKYAHDSPIIFGVEKMEQLVENLSLFRKIVSKPSVERTDFSAAGFPERLINPSLWQKTLSA